MKLLFRSLPKWQSFIIPCSFQLVIVILLFYLNQTYGGLYNGIQTYNIHEIWVNISIFTSLAFGLVITSGYSSYFNNILLFKIREKLYSNVITNYTKLNMTRPQRLQEDVYRVCESAVDIGSSLFSAAIKLPVFAYVIASLTQWWVAAIIIGLVVIGTYTTKLMANGLVISQSSKETKEANFRNQLSKNEVEFIPKYVKDAFNIWNKQLKSLLFLQSGLGQTFALLPFILLMPLYLSKVITLGAFFQSVHGLSNVVDSLSVIINNRVTISALYTSLSRLEELNARK